MKPSREKIDAVAQATIAPRITSSRATKAEQTIPRS
jgi:hypothetical protein